MRRKKLQCIKVKIRTKARAQQLKQVWEFNTYDDMVNFLIDAHNQLVDTDFETLEELAQKRR